MGFRSDICFSMTSLRLVRTLTPRLPLLTQLQPPNLKPSRPMSSAKKEGDISNAFTSLSQAHQDPLPDHYRHLKISLIQGHEEAVVASWKRLLARLKVENREVERRRSGVVPRVRYGELVNGLSEERKRDIRARGVVVVEGVVEEEVARGYKSSVEEYVKANPHTTSLYQAKSHSKP